MTTHRITWLALAVAGSMITAQAGLVNFESRSTSWTNNLTSVSNQTSHAGKLDDGSYIDGMWSYVSLNYALGSGPSTFVPTTMDYHNNPYGNVFALGGWTPNASSTTLIQHWSNMPHDGSYGNYGIALAFTNVLGYADTFTLSGSYGVDQGDWAPHYVDSWIYVVSGGTTTVLSSSRIQTNPLGYAITLATPLTAMLQPGDKIYIAVGGEGEGSGGDHYRLYDAGLTWSVPEPASLALLSLGGLALLRRRRG